MIVDFVALDDPAATDRSRVGAKAAGLATLVASGFDVPPGAVAPVELATSWPSGPAPDWLVERVEKVLCELDGPVAVRSSATWEDGGVRAHAGATATILDVERPSDVVAAIRTCLDHSAARQLAEGERGGIGIIIQALVPAEHAGVAFTADPVSGDRDVVRIASTAGLGEALVQGEVVGSDITVRGNDISGDLADLPVDVVHRVAALARRVEAHFEQPQDIEWAIADGTLCLLQARPITVLPTRPTYPEGNNWQKDTSHYPEPLTPFGYSVIHACSDDIAAVFDEMGAMILGLEEHFAGGEVYARPRPAFGSADSASKPPPAPILGLVSRLAPAIRKRVVKARRAQELALPDRWLAEWFDHQRDDAERRSAQLSKVKLDTLDRAGLLDALDDRLVWLREGMTIHFRLTITLMHRMHALHEFTSDQLGWVDHRTSELLVGHSPATRAADEALAGLRARIDAVPGARDALDAHPGAPLQAIAKLDAGLAEDLSAWIGEHGWAAINYDAGIPTLAERPTLLTALLLAKSATTDHAHADAVAAEARSALAPKRVEVFERLLRRAREVYPVREDNVIIVGDRPIALLRRWMLEAGRRLVDDDRLPHVDDAAYLMLHELRDAIAGTSSDDLVELVARRRNEEAWARLNPGPVHIGKQAELPDISRVPEPLRWANEPVLWAVGHEYPAAVEVPDDIDVLTTGVAASPGIAEGTVRVIRTHNDVERLQPGDVLVCTITTPAWAPMFSLATAIVADGGGVLSHAAIAAREHGLPAVLGTADATTTLVDGQRIRVDGGRGLVTAAD